MLLLAFFLLTFTLTWVAWMVSAALAGPASAGISAIGGPVFLLGVFAPALVALALTGFAEGSAGVRRLLGRIGRWQVDTRWFVMLMHASVNNATGVVPAAVPAAADVRPVLHPAARSDALSAYNARIYEDSPRRDG